MEQPNKASRKAYNDIVEDMPTIVPIKGTRKVVKIKGMKPYTIERLTKLWLTRDASISNESSDTLKSLCTDPYFSIKQAVLMSLNTYWSIRLFYGLRWRIWAYLRNYSEEQMMPIIQEGKKKLPLIAFWSNMVFSVDMRNDWMKMTNKEAEQYRAELLSAMKQLSAKNSQTTGKAED